MAITKGTVVHGSLTTAWDGSGFRASLAVTIVEGQNALNVRIVGTSNRMPPSAVTFNGQTLTAIPGTSIDDGDQKAVVQFDCLNPSVGPFTVVVTSAAETTYRVIATPLAGVNPETPHRDADGAAAYNTAPTVSLTTEAGDLVLDVGHSGAAPTPHESQTSDAVADTYAFASSKIAAGEATAPLWSQGEARWVISAVAYVPNGDDPPTPSAAAILASQFPGFHFSKRF